MNPAVLDEAPRDPGARVPHHSYTDKDFEGKICISKISFITYNQKTAMGQNVDSDKLVHIFSLSKASLCKSFIKLYIP